MLLALGPEAMHGMRESTTVLVEPLGRVRFESLKRASVRIHTREVHVFTQVVFAVDTQKAAPARHTRLNSNTITWLQAGDTVTATYDHSCRLMANDAIAFEHKAADAPRFPEVDVRSVAAVVVVRHGSA